MNITNKIEIIAGPCSVESREQVLATAKALSALGIKLFRAGVWKPRSHPSDFEGVGVVALEWLKEVKEKFSMDIAVEVAREEHVSRTLASGITTFWLGSRTTSNPFAVQEIADTIASYIEERKRKEKGKREEKGRENERGEWKEEESLQSPLKVYIKNPLSPDIELWSGAVERILLSGVKMKDIALIHRGFTSYDRSIYRNAPMWNIAIQMHKRYPQLPLICDPSHIAGDRKYVQQIAQQALNLSFDGLMVEVHNNPSIAKSDSLQQLLPEEFAQMLENLNVKASSQKDKVSPKIGKEESMELLREEIDLIDSKILSLLSERMEVSKYIGEYKREKDMPLYQDERYNSMIAKRGEEGDKKGLSKTFVKRVMDLIHSESLENQIKNTINESKKN